MKRCGQVVADEEQSQVFEPAAPGAMEAPAASEAQLSLIGTTMD